MFPAGRMVQLRRLKGAGGEESWDAVWIAAGEEHRREERKMADLRAYIWQGCRNSLTK